jgi:hypothetical protein
MLAQRPIAGRMEDSLPSQSWLTIAARHHDEHGIFLSHVRITSPTVYESLRHWRTEDILRVFLLHLTGQASESNEKKRSRHLEAV